MSRKPQTWFRSRVLPRRLYPTAGHPDHPDIPAQVWAQLRSQGIRTPEIAAWQRAPYEYQVRIYDLSVVQSPLSARDRTVKSASKQDRLASAVT